MNVVMTIESKSQSIYNLHKIEFIICQFIDKCKLSSHHFPHKIPDCDVVCSDYLSQQEISDSIESSEAILINEEIKEILPL